MSSSSAAPPHAKQHVSFVVIGHSQCGKSTVVGAMLQLTDSLPGETFEGVEAAANTAGQTMRRFAWISDKTKDERDRLHTITPKLWCLESDDQRISLIDSPGHRSCSLMCIASLCMADAALLVVSAKRGSFEEGIDKEGGTRMHLLAAYALGIKSVIVAVSQLDDPSCSFGQTRFREIEERMRLLLRKVGFNPHHVLFVPVAAVFGDCIIERSPRISWYEGPPLLSAMRDVRAMQKYGEKPLRACILYKMHVGGVGVVLFVRVLTGLLRAGMSLSLCLADSSHEVASIQMHHTPLYMAQCGDVVGVQLKGNVDKCQRGDILSDTRSGKAVATTAFTAHMCIVDHPTQIHVGYAPVVTAHTTHVPCRVVDILSLLDKASGRVVAQAPASVKRGDVCVVRMVPMKPVVMESFADYPPLGRICWFDSGCIVAVGVIKTIEHTKVQPPLPPKVEAARAAKAAAAASARAGV